MFYIEKSKIKNGQKVCLISPDFFPVVGGMATSVLSFCLRAKKEGLSPIIVTQRVKDSESRRRRSEYIQRHNIELLEVGSFNNIKVIASILELLLKKRRIGDIALFHAISPYGAANIAYSLSFLLKVPYIVSVQGYIFSELWKNLRWGITRRLLFYKRTFFLFRKAHRIHVDGLDLKVYLFSYGVPQEKVIVSKNEIHTEVIDSDVCDLQDRGYILFLSRFEQRLGAMEAIRIYHKYLGCSLEKKKLLMIGDGEEMPKVVDYIGKHGLEGQVRLVGKERYDRLGAYYKQCSVFLMPIIWCGGIPQVFEKARKYGVRVIAYKTNMSSLIFEKDMENVVLVNVFDRDACVRELLALE